MFGYASILVLFLCGTTTAWCTSLDVYKWVDDDGSIHYGDRERVPYAEKITVRHSGAASAPAAAETGPESEQDGQSRASSEVCKRTRALLDDYRKAPFLYEEVDGKRKILSDQERKRIESRAEKDVEAACGVKP